MISQTSKKLRAKLVRQIREFMCDENGGVPLPNGGYIHPEAVADILLDEPLELISCLQ